MCKAMCCKLLQKGCQTASSAVQPWAEGLIQLAQPAPHTDCVVVVATHPQSDCQSPLPCAKALSALRFRLSVFTCVVASARCRLSCMQQIVDTRKTMTVQVQKENSEVKQVRWCRHAPSYSGWPPHSRLEGCQSRTDLLLNGLSADDTGAAAVLLAF